MRPCASSHCAAGCDQSDTDCRPSQHYPNRTSHNAPPAAHLSFGPRRRRAGPPAGAQALTSRNVGGSSLFCGGAGAEDMVFRVSRWRGWTVSIVACGCCEEGKFCYKCVFSAIALLILDNERVLCVLVLLLVTSVRWLLMEIFDGSHCFCDVEIGCDLTSKYICSHFSVCVVDKFRSNYLVELHEKKSNAAMIFYICIRLCSDLFFSCIKVLAPTPLRTPTKWNY